MTYLIASLIVSGCALIASATTAIMVYKNSQKANSMERMPLQPLPLTFEDVNVIIEGIIAEIFNNKYLLYYKLKEITVIPKMDEEITTITKEVINAFSDTLIHEIERYYSREFLVIMITRKVQILLVDYTNNNKPNTK